MTRFFYFISLLSCIFTFGQEQKFEFERISTLDGLSQNNVLSIYKDSRGFLWFGTYDGLNRYNGYEFKVYRATDKTNPLTSNFIKCITEDALGNIWCGTFNSGINRLNTKTGEVTQFRNTKENPHLFTDNNPGWLMLDSKGRIWLGGTEGLNIITQDVNGEISVQQITNNPDDPESLFFKNIQSIFEDSKGRIFIGTTYNLELMVMDDDDQPQNKFIHFITDTIIRDIKEIVEVPEGILFSNYDGATILKLNEDNLEESEIVELEDHSSFYITVDFDGNVWTCGSEGLYFFEHRPDEAVPYVLTKHITDGENVHMLSNLFVRAMHLDNTGILWLGTNGGGICKYNGRKTKFRHYSKNSNPGSLGHNKVWSFLEDKQNNLWVSTEGDGINFIPAKNKKNYANGFTESIRVNPPGGQNYGFEMLDVSKEGGSPVIWAGTGYNHKMVEISRQPNGKFAAYPRFPEITHQVMVIEMDEYENVWMGTYDGGIYKYINDGNNSQLINYRASNSKLPTSIIRNIEEDSRGRLWIGTDVGLLVLTKEQKLDNALNFKTFLHDTTNDKSLSKNYTVPIIEDSEGVIWVGTFGGGLNRYHEGSGLTNGTFSSIRKKDGLASDNIYGLVEDNDGNLWVTTNNGISRIDKARKKIRNFDVHDGLQHMAFTDLSCKKLSDGEILIGGVKGFNAFYPNEIMEDTTPPVIVLGNLNIMNKPVSVNVPFNNRVILNNTLNETREIELEYSENNFTLDFAALHFSLPGKNLYKYMLEGVDEDWINASADSRFARYTNISAGTYTFKVLASNCYGVWAKEPKELIIHINPPYYQTWWFRISALIVFGSIVYIVYRRRMGKIKREQAALQAKIDESMLQLNKSKKEIEKTKAEVEEHKEQMRLREIEELEIRFFNTGLAKFSDIINKQNNLTNLCRSVISELTKYVDGQMGIIYIVSEYETDETLQAQGSYGSNITDLEGLSIMFGEGNVGTAFKMGEVIKLENIPDTFMKISSGLGEIKPGFVCFVPLMQNQDKIGVIEIASFKAIDDYKIEFIKKLGENITSSVLLMRILAQHEEIIDEAQTQAEELMSQEEEMRQNIEELMATQEEHNRLKEQFEEKVKYLEEHIVKKDKIISASEIEIKELKSLVEQNNDSLN